MRRNNKKTILAQGLVLCLGLLFGLSAQADLWVLDSVNNGSDGSFGYSGIHDAHTSPAWSGSAIAGSTGFVSGSFNDVTGAFDTVINLSMNSGFGATGANTLSLSGTMAGFGTSGTGLLSAGRVLTGVLGTAITINNISFSSIDIGFLPGVFCCDQFGSGTTYDPNGFYADPASTNRRIMSLWGASWDYSGSTDACAQGSTTFNPDCGGVPGHSYDGALLGVDLRTHWVRSTPPDTSVPEPGTFALIGLGLLGFGFRRHIFIPVS